MSKNLDETVRLQSERKVETREKREKLHGAARGWSSAPRLANSSVMSSTGRNEYQEAIEPDKNKEETE